MGPVATIAADLQKRIVNIAKWTPFQEVHVVFEDLLGTSFAKRERLRALIGQGLAGVRIQGADLDALSEWLQRFAVENAPGLRPLIKLELAILATCFDDALAGSGLL